MSETNLVKCNWSGPLFGAAYDDAQCYGPGQLLDLDDCWYEDGKLVNRIRGSGDYGACPGCGGAGFTNADGSRIAGFEMEDEDE